MSIKRSCLLPALLLLLAAPLAHAQNSLIVSDSFNDPTGAITGRYGGYGWQYQHDWTSSSSTNPDQVTAGSLSFSQNGATLVTSGNKLTTVGSDVGAYRRPPTDLGPYGGSVNQDIWIGFLAANTTSSLSLFNTTEQFFIGAPLGVGGYGFQNDSVRGLDGSPQFLDSSFVPADTTTHFLVTHLSFTASGTTTVSLYVDPTPGVDTTDTNGNHYPTQLAAVEKVYTTPFQFNEVRFQSGSDAHGYNFDELRMGNTYLDVAPAVVPEPGPAVVLGAGASFLALAACRRRKKGAAD